MGDWTLKDKAKIKNSRNPSGYTYYEEVAPGILEEVRIDDEEENSASSSSAADANASDLELLREDRIKLVMLRTKLEIEKTKNDLENLTEKSKQGPSIQNLAIVTALLGLVIGKTGRYNAALMFISTMQAQEIVKELLLEGKEKRVGSLIIELKPGYEQEAEKQLADMIPTHPLVEFYVLTLRLKLVGYIVVREE